MKKTVLLARLTLAILGAAAGGVSIQAAVVTFGDPVILSGERDIITTGSLDRAVSLGGSEQTVSGVKFEAGLTLTLHDLKKGTTYLVQFFVNDSRDFHGGNRHETVHCGDLISEVVNFSSTGTTGGVGEFITATFTADDLKQDFVFTPVDTASDDAQINALQLRVVPSSEASAVVPPREGK